MINEDTWKQMLPAVRSIAGRYARLYSVDPEDLTQEAFLGLVSADRLYDPNKGASFHTYAEMWIRQTARRYCENNSGAVRMPVYARSGLHQYRRFMSEFEQAAGRPPERSEVLEGLQLTPEQLDQIKRDALMSRVGSLDAPIGDDEEGDSFVDLVPGDADPEEEAVEAVTREELQKTVRECVDMLPEKLAATVRARYLEGVTLKEIAADLGVSLTRVHALELSGIRKMRKSHEIRKRLEPFLDAERFRMGVSGTSVGAFRRSGSSSTERAAIKMIEGHED